jgi:hypothetical protein
MVKTSDNNNLEIDPALLRPLQQSVSAIQAIQRTLAGTDIAALAQQVQATSTALQILRNTRTEQFQLIKNASSSLQLAIRMLRSFPAIPLLPSSLAQLESETAQEPDEHMILEQPETELIVPEIRLAILPYSPTLVLLEKLLRGEVRHDALGWREFEEAVAELLEKDGHEVILGPGRKDGGKDIFAVKEVEEIGPIITIWQAKKLSPGHKVELGVIRELADTCRETPATKGIVVTTTHLTRDALLRVQKDRFMLGKRDQDDLLRWIQRIKKQKL